MQVTSNRKNSIPWLRPKNKHGRYAILQWTMDVFGLSHNQPHQGMTKKIASCCLVCNTIQIFGKIDPCLVCTNWFGEHSMSSNYLTSQLPKYEKICKMQAKKKKLTKGITCDCFRWNLVRTNHVMTHRLITWRKKIDTLAACSTWQQKSGNIHGTHQQRGQVGMPTCKAAG